MRIAQTGLKACSRSLQKLSIVLLPLLLAVSCDQYPRDPEGSLKQIEQSAMLHVGVMLNPPWVAGNAPASPAGVEAQLIEQFAQELGVEVVWHWGGEEKLFEGLKTYELNILIGGITTDNPWTQHSGFTVPYFSSEVLVGSPPGQAPLSSLEGVSVATRQGEGLSEKIEKAGGRAQFMADFTGAEIPVAAPSWEIDTLGMQNTDITLQERHHVMAVPKGENALLMRLEDFLLEHADRETIVRLLATQVTP